MAFFNIPPSKIDKDSRIAILDDEEDMRHLVKVLRAQEGEQVTFTNGVDERYEGTIKEITRLACIVSIDKINSIQPPTCLIDLFQGLPKGEKTELIVQKTTELGIERIIMVDTERVIVKLKDEKSKKSKTERWQKIAEEACKQCQRMSSPTVEDLIPFKAVIDRIPDYDVFLVPYEQAEGFGLGAFKRAYDAKTSSADGQVMSVRIGYFIGPEGGISDRELEQLTNAGAVVVTLGPRILRTETAAIATLTMLQTLFGDMAGR